MERANLHPNARQVVANEAGAKVSQRSPLSVHEFMRRCNKKSLCESNQFSTEPDKKFNMSDGGEELVTGNADRGQNRVEPGSPALDQFDVDYEIPEVGCNGKRKSFGSRPKGSKGTKNMKETKRSGPQWKEEEVLILEKEWVSQTKLLVKAKESLWNGI